MVNNESFIRPCQTEHVFGETVTSTMIGLTDVKEDRSRLSQGLEEANANC